MKFEELFIVQIMSKIYSCTLSSSIGIMRQIYNHIQIEEYKSFRHIYHGIYIKITNKVESFGE